VDEQTAQALLADKGLSGTPAAWQRLVAGYAGNPLALKIVAQAVSDLFGGDLDRFLEEGELVFNGVRPVLRQQVGRLSPLEHLLLTWLAVLRERTTLHTLSQVLHPRVLRAQLLEALEALSRRSLLERGQQASFGLQSVVMEYLTDELGEQFSKEIVLGNPQHLRQVALSQAQAKDYVREIQVRLLVQPLLERLRAELGANAQVEAHLPGLLAQFRAEHTATQGYGPANVITLLIALRGHLRGLDLSRLSLRGAYLQGVQMQDASLSGALLQECVFTETFDAIIAVVTSLTGQYWAAGSKRGEVRVWREGGQILHLARQAHTDQTYGLAFSPDERMLASGSLDGSVKLWDVETGTLLWSGWQTQGTVWLAFAPDGSLLANGGLEGTVRLWDPKLGTTLQELPHPGMVFSLAWSPDGHLLASGTLLQGVLLWDGAARSGRWVSRQLPTRLRRVAWSPDGTRLVGGGDDGHVYVWDAADGTLLQRLAGHQGAVNSVAWSPDGLRGCQPGQRGTLRVECPQRGAHLHSAGADGGGLCRRLAPGRTAADHWRQ